MKEIIPLMGSIDSNPVLVSPTRAAQLLKRNTENNRPLSKATADRYTKDIKSGNFVRLSPVVIDSDGYVIDGQHTLSAIAQSGVSTPLFFHRNVSSALMRYLDQGKGRSIRDLAAMDGMSERVNTVTSIASFCVKWEDGVRNGSLSGSSPRQVVLNFITDNTDDLLAAASIADRVRRSVHIPASVLGFIYFYAAQNHQDKADEFFEALETGAGLSVGHPALTLRNRVAREHNKRTDNVAMLVRAWNAYADGKTIDRVYGYIPGKPIPEIR